MLQQQTLSLNNMLVRLAWIGPLAPARKLALAGTPAQPCFAPLQKKISGTEVRQTLDEMTDQSLNHIFEDINVCNLEALISFIYFRTYSTLRFVIVVIFIIFLVKFEG